MTKNTKPILWPLRRPHVALFALMLASGFAHADELGDLLRGALDNPAVEAAKGQTAAADALSASAQGLYYGQANLNYGVRRYSDVRVVGQYSSPIRGEDLTMAGASYVLPIDLFGQVSATVDKASGEAAATRLGWRRQQLAKLHQTLGAYYSLYALEQRREALAAYRKWTESLVKRLEAEVELGRSAPVQVRYARSQEFRLQSNEVQLQGDIATAQASLAEATGKTDVQPRASAIVVPDWQEVVPAEALAVKLAQSREAVAAAAERQARANLLPRLSADVGYSATRAAGTAAGGGTRDDWGVGLTLSLPLGVSAFRQEDAARASRLAAIDATRASLRETESAIAALRAQYLAAIAEIAAMEKETLYRQEIVDIEREMHRLGNQTLENLFRHEDDLLEARSRFALAQARAAATWSGLQLLAGSEPESYIATLEKAVPHPIADRKTP